MPLWSASILIYVTMLVSIDMLDIKFGTGNLSNTYQFSAQA